MGEGAGLGRDGHRFSWHLDLVFWKSPILRPASRGHPNRPAFLYFLFPFDVLPDFVGPSEPSSVDFLKAEMNQAAREVTFSCEGFSPFY